MCQACDKHPTMISFVPTTTPGGGEVGEIIMLMVQIREFVRSHSQEPTSAQHCSELGFPGVKVRRPW